MLSHAQKSVVFLASPKWTSNVGLTSGKVFDAADVIKRGSLNGA